MSQHPSPHVAKSEVRGEKFEVRSKKLAGRFFALLTSTLTFLTSSFAADTAKLEITDPLAALALEVQGARLIATYDTFQLWEAPAAAAEAAAANSPGVHVRTGDDTIELSAQPINTSGATKNKTKANIGNFSGKHLHLIQYAGPIKPEWLAELKQLGLTIVSHVPRNAYLVYGDAMALQALRQLAAEAPHIQFETEYLGDHKLHPTAQAAHQLAKAKQATEDLFAIQLIADPLGNAATLQWMDQNKTQLVKRYQHLNYENIILRLPPERLPDLASRPDVVSIQLYRVPQKRDERQGQILAGNLTGNGPTAPGYLPWLQTKGFNSVQFTTSGFAVDVSDSGIDNGTQAPGHPGLYVLGNTANASRVAYNRLLGTPNFGSTIQACDGHGNINSHIIAGFNDLIGFPHTDSAGYHYGLGICPWVRVGSSVIFDPDTFTFPNYFELQSRAYQDGARISCNSWGAAVFGTYNIDCQQYDSLVRDAQQATSPFPTPGNQEMIIVFSAGNSGSGFGSIGAPGAAKNIISVGAAENVHSHSSSNGGSDAAGTDGCGITDTGADSANDIIYFSSRGPCDDGRIKPDIMGPGTHVTGGVGQQNNPGANGTALACFVASGVCGLNSGGFFPVAQQFYTTSSGTSHSCPAVGGGAALLRQYFINHFWPIPSPAMTKAWLMSSSRYMTGLGANDTLPSNNQGMGSMNLGMAFDEVPRIRRDQLAIDRFTASGQTRVFNGFIADPAKPLRVTLAYTDAPGNTFGNAYNNDLDLTLVVNGQTYHGNVFAGATSITGGLADPRNNVESVFLPAGLSGPFTITITAANINSDGVPGNADPLDQDFALVVYNSSDRPVLLVSAGSNFTAESCNPPNAAPDPGETVTVNLSLRNVGPSNSVNVVATLLPTGGVTAPDGPQNYGVITANGGTAARNFTFTASGICGSTVTATLQLQDGTNDLGTAAFSWVMGTLTTNLNSASNAAPIAISAVDGAVAPYPSTVNVAGIPGVISGLTVTLHSLAHSWPEDLDILLVGPNGQSAMLMSDVGSQFDVTNLTLIFSDNAASGLPDDSPLVSGTWRPTNFELDSPLPAPAPAGPYTSLLSAFNGTSPNGAWRLFVVDDYTSDDGGEIAGGWSLSLTTTSRVCCLNPAAVDLVVTESDSPDPVSVSNIVTYIVTVTNRGPAIASDVILTQSFSAQAEFVSAAVSQGTYGLGISGDVIWPIGTLPPFAGASAQIQVRAIGGPEITGVATVASSSPDYDLGNNQATAITTVSVPALSVIGTTIVEGDSGTRDAVVLIALSHTSPQTVAVSYRTAPGTALSGLDFITQSNRVQFAPGEVVKTFIVPIIGDLLDEDDEVFSVQLLDPSNAGIQVAEAFCTIVDDDALPTVSISNALVVEGNSGTTNAVFTVSISPVSGRAVSVAFNTANGTALAGSDYSAASQNVTISAGSTGTGIVVSVSGDSLIESDETFLAQLSSPTNAVISDGLGVGTIVSDDLAPIVSVAGYRVLSESLLPANGAIDPGETVTVSLALLNIGSAPTTNLVVSLLAVNGVQSPSGPQAYGALPPGGQASRPFTFTIANTNCGSIEAVVQASDGAANLGNVPFPIQVGGDVEFIIHSLSATGVQLVDHNNLTSDDRGGVALSHSQAFVTGDSSTARFNVTNLSGGVALGTIHDGLVSDLRTEAVYLLGNGDVPIGISGGTVSSLLPLDGNTGFRSGDRINLSTNISMPSGSGIFAGYGRIVLHNGAHVFEINPVTGLVTDLGAMASPLHAFSESWAYWGVAEYFGGTTYLTYVQNFTTISRARVPDGAISTVASFSSLGDMASFSVSPRLERWYFHYEGSAQFGGSSETLGFADATMSVVCGNSAPIIIRQPLPQTAFENGSVLFDVAVVGSKPLSYQWRLHGTNLPGATGSSLAVANVTSNNVGPYFVIVSNLYGSATSAVVQLSVLSAGSGFLDDFDPDIDLIQWTSFGGALGSQVAANANGGFVSAPNSLWFGNSDLVRHATSRPLNTSGGGLIGFDIRLGSGSFPWEQVDVPGEGISFSYSLNGGGSWIEIGRYDDTSFYNWTHISMQIPPGAQAPSVMFRWQQLSHSGACCDNWALDNVFVASGPAPPQITSQPVSRSVVLGGTATFGVGVSGSTPLFYQWRFNGVNRNNATNSTLIISGVTSNDVGGYSVVVSNVHGSVTSAVAQLSIAAVGTLNALLLWDQTNATTLALKSALEAAGINVTFSDTDENFYNGNNPPPGGFNAVIHLNGTTYSQGMLAAGQAALVNFVQNGGGYIHTEWDAYELENNSMLGMRELIVFDRTDGFEGSLTYAVVSGQQGHPAIANVPSTFTFSAGASRVVPHFFVTQPVTVLMNDTALGSAAAVAVREFGLGRVVGFNHAGNYNSSLINNTLLNPNVQQLFIDGLRWAAGLGGSTSSPPSITSQPVSRSVVLGGTTTFGVGATGAPPLFYQWRFNGANRIGATNATLVISGVTSNDVGGYSVVVNNAHGSVTSAVAQLTISAVGTVNALLLWDVTNANTLALKSAIEAAGINVTLSDTDENFYNGNNPALGSFNAVIHLNGTTYSAGMLPAGQAALVNFVQNGGGYIHTEWDAYELGNGSMLAMRDLIVFDRTDGFEGNLTYAAVAGQQGHPVIANVPSNFTFSAGASRVVPHVFSTQAVTVLMNDTALGNAAAVAVREFGLGRMVGFNHAGNYESSFDNNTLLNPNVQQLFIDGLRWAAGSGGSIVTSPPPAQSVFIDFEDAPAPVGFASTRRLTNRYAPLGVTFEGPGGLDGGAILNQFGGWTVSGHSPTNFLAFNTTATMQDGGRAQGPETIRFSPLATRVSLKVGAGSGSVTLTAYDPLSNVVQNVTSPLVNACTTLQVTGAAIARVVLSTTSTLMIVDDISVTFLSPPLVFLPPTLGTNQVLLRFPTIAGRSYTIRYKNFLQDVSWQALQTVVGDGTVRTVPTSVTATQRFYRLTTP